MNKIKLIIFILTFGMNFIMANAKLTIAYADTQDQYCTINLLTEAKIRQALVEMHGEDWFKKFFSKTIKQRIPSLWIYVGNNGELILEGKNYDIELMHTLKQALDYLSVKGDTLYCLEPYNRREEKKLSFVLNHKALNKLFVNIPYKKDIKLQLMFFNVGGDNLDFEYKKECKKNDCLDLEHVGFNNPPLRPITKKDIDLYYKYTMKKDKDLLFSKAKPTLIISDFYYQYNDNKKEYYVKKGDIVNEITLIVSEAK